MKMETTLMESPARNNGSDFNAAPSGLTQNAQTQMVTTRAAQEVQAAMIVAKQYPRDENAAFARVMQACKRKRLADEAIYAYPRGNETVSGPSIRMAEVMAQCWGNIDFGIIELEQKTGESQVMAYAWDLETNTRQTKIFAVKHERHTKRGKNFLSDPRDIYELVANQGARRLRACILGVIPGDVVDAAVSECEKTMAGGNTEPLADRVRKMLVAFQEIGVTVEMIEKRLNHKTDSMIEPELVNLRKIYKSIKDGMSSPADFFGNTEPEPQAATGTKADGVAEQLASKMAESSTDDAVRPTTGQTLAMLKTSLVKAKNLDAVKLQEPRIANLPEADREEGRRLYDARVAELATN